MRTAVPILLLASTLSACDGSEVVEATASAVDAATIHVGGDELEPASPPTAQWHTVRSDLGFEVQFPGPARRVSLSPQGVLAADYYVYEGTDAMFEVAAMQFAVAALRGRSDQALLEVAKTSLREGIAVEPSVEIASMDVRNGAAIGHRLRYQTGDRRITKWVFVSGAFAYHVTTQTPANANTSADEAKFFDSLVLTPPTRPGA